MATFEDTNVAAQTLKQSLGSPDWLLGVGVGKQNDNFVVAVRVTAAAPVNAVPTVVSGIPVQIEQREMPKAQ